MVESRPAAGGRRSGLGRRLRLRSGRRLTPRSGPRFAPGSMTLPELSSAAAERWTFLTAQRSRRARRRRRGEECRVGGAAVGLRDDPLPMLDPHPTARRRSAASGPRRVRASRRRGDRADRRGGDEQGRAGPRGGRPAPSAHDPAALFGAMREQFPSCFCFCCGTPEAAFIGASPELLVRRAGRRASRPSRWPARPGAAPTRPSTTTSASSCCAATRTGASSGSSPSGSSAPCARTRSGSRRRPSRRSSRWPTSSTWRPR